MEREKWEHLGSTEIRILYIYDYSTIAKEVSGEGCLTSCGDPPVGSISREQHHQTGDAVHPVNEARKCSEEIHYISTAQVTTNFFVTYSFQPNVLTWSKFHYQATSQLGRHCINSPVMVKMDPPKLVPPGTNFLINKDPPELIFLQNMDSL